MDAYCDEWEAMWTSEHDKPDFMKNNGTKNGTDSGNSTDSGDGKDTPKSAKSAVPKGDDNKNKDKAEEKSDATPAAGEGSLPSELTKGAPAAEPAKDTEKKEEAAAGELPKELTKGSEPAKEEGKAAAQPTSSDSGDDFKVPELAA